MRRFDPMIDVAFIAGAVTVVLLVTLPWGALVEEEERNWEAYGKCVHEMHIRKIELTPAIKDYCLQFKPEEDGDGVKASDMVE